MQEYATTNGSSPIAGVDSNYGMAIGKSWAVGSGSEELNGTYDMMGNVWEWMENPWTDGNYSSSSDRTVRGGSFKSNDNFLGRSLGSSIRSSNAPHAEGIPTGFRVASIPEPATIGLLALGGLAVIKRRR